MPKAADFISARVVTVEAEMRLADAAGAIGASNATHCAVIDAATGRLVGIVRLADAALRPSQRIFADLVAPDLPPSVPEDAEVGSVAKTLQEASADEALVMSETGRFIGLITREGLLEWALREQDRTQKKLQEEIDRREATIRDQTAHLRQALKEAERYATFASHDLRTPLRAIHWYSDMLLESSSSLDTAGRGYLERIRSASLRMDALIVGFLEEGRGPPAMEGDFTTDLDLAVDEAVELCQRLIAERGAQVSVAKPLHAVHGRPAVVVRVVTNLLSNAIKHAPEHRPPIVQFRSAIRGDEVWLSIQDNGAGMPGTFRPGTAEAASKAAAADAQGLGLLIVERAVNRLGGALSLQSSPGEGSTFTVRLPRAGAPRP